MIDFSGFKMLTFDCYGTLIDWETGILAVLSPLVSNRGLVVSDDELLVMYGKIESAIEAEGYRSYREVLAQIVTGLGAKLGFVPSKEETVTLAESLKNWPPFVDTVESLKRLKKKYKLGIISNIDNDLFAWSNRHLQVKFDAIITAQQAQAYKPSLKTFDYALREIGLLAHEILHVAQSLFHDHVPAKKLGLSTVWINRRRTKPGDSFGATPEAVAQPDAEFYDLKSLADAVGL